MNAFREILMRICLCGIALAALAILCYGLRRTIRDRVADFKKAGRVTQLVAVGFVAIMVCYGGTKPPEKTWTIIFQNGLRDNGSVCDGDEIRAKWQPTSAVILDGYEVRAQYKNKTIEGDTWHDLEGCRVSDLQKTWIVPDAENLHVVIWAEYVAPPQVHTNGVYKLNGVQREMGGTQKYVTPGVPIIGPEGEPLTFDGELSENLLNRLADELKEGDNEQ